MIRITRREKEGEGVRLKGQSVAVMVEDNYQELEVRYLCTAFRRLAPK
jgi:hypothetical protein